MSFHVREDREDEGTLVFQGLRQRKTCSQIRPLEVCTDVRNQAAINTLYFPWSNISIGSELVDVWRHGTCNSGREASLSREHEFAVFVGEADGKVRGPELCRSRLCQPWAVVPPALRDRSMKIDH